MGRSGQRGNGTAAAPVRRSYAAAVLEEALEGKLSRGRPDKQAREDLKMMLADAIHWATFGASNGHPDVEEKASGFVAGAISAAATLVSQPAPSLAEWKESFQAGGSTQVIREMNRLRAQTKAELERKRPNQAARSELRTIFSNAERASAGDPFAFGFSEGASAAAVILAGMDSGNLAVALQI